MGVHRFRAVLYKYILVQSAAKFLEKVNYGTVPQGLRTLVTQKLFLLSSNTEIALATGESSCDSNIQRSEIPHKHSLSNRSLTSLQKRLLEGSFSQTRQTTEARAVAHSASRDRNTRSQHPFSTRVWPELGKGTAY